MSGRRRVVVVGGGLTGLATAWYLRDDANVVVLEATTRLGGEIRTTDFADVPFDVGADAFLARQAGAEELARAAGFADDDLVAPVTRRVHLWVRGRLRPLPSGTVFGVPTDLRAVARSGVITRAGVARARLEPFLPHRPAVGDRSIADFVGDRFGREVVDVLVEPLVSGVYAGLASRLSAEAAIPSVWAAGRDHRSLTAGLMADRRRSAQDDRPVFLTLRGGLSRLVDRLADDLGDAVRRDVEVVGLTRKDGHWQVETSDGLMTAGQVVVAVPPPVAARLLVRVAPEAARELAGIPVSSVAVVALAYDHKAATAVPDGSGFLVPRTEGRLVKAATWTSRKWPHHADGSRFLLRASVGRIDDSAALELDDDTLAERVDAEVRAASRIAAKASERLVVRWHDALPQYEVGHLSRVDRIRAALEDAPAGLHVGGAALDGVGLAARARDAGRLAANVRAGLMPQARSRRAAPGRL